MTIHRIQLTVLFAVVMWGVPGWAGPFTELIVFGGSLDDNGNIYSRFGIPPVPPYFDGRYSNGPVWVERLAEQLGVPAPIASERGGTNYAWGGATTGSVRTDFADDMDEQVQLCLSENTANADQLFVLSTGPWNDFAKGQSDPSEPVRFLSDQVSQLAASGGRHFLILNLPSNAEPSDLVQQFNMLLSEELSNLRSSNKALKIVEFDYFGLVEEIMADPAAFGFVDARLPACKDCGSGNPSRRPVDIVSNPDEYFFWDNVHPSGSSHQIIADAAYGLLPGRDGPQLQAGDANMDHEFNQLDLAQVQIAAKYLTGKFATWGEGDWNGAPGGSLGYPPPGDGVFDQLDIIAALNAGTYLQEAYYDPDEFAALSPVPEPSTVVLLVLGIAGVTLRRRSGQS